MVTEPVRKEEEVTNREPVITKDGSVLPLKWSLLFVASYDRLDSICLSFRSAILCEFADC